MDFFLKRIPAFSRALGEWESDEDSESEFDLEEISSFDLDGKPITLAQVFEKLTFKEVIIGIGPLQTTFVTCAFRLEKSNLVAIVLYHTPGFGGTQTTVRNEVRVYYNPHCCGGALCIVSPASKQVPHINQRLVVRRIMDSAIHTTKDTRKDFQVNILCSLPVSQFQSRTPPDKPSFVRILATHEMEKLKDTPCEWLEQPNIISGQPAEFLTWSRVHSVPAVLYTLFYTPLDNPCYAWQSAKEIFTDMCAVKTIRPMLPVDTGNWDSVHDSALKDSCVMYICGDKPTKMDQMYT